MSEYLELARQGKNDWWRYLISFPAILVLWLSVGSVPVILLLAYVSMDGDPATSFSGTGFVGVPVILEFLVTMSSFIPFLAATLLAVRFIHARSLKTLVTAAARIRWGRIFAGAGAWLLIAALLSALESLLYPGRYVFTFQPLLLLFVVFAFVLIPIQTSAEEFFFRGYLLQWMGLRWKNPWLLSFLNGALFFLPHAANPEMATNSLLIGLGYFAMGFFFSLITLRDQGIELALGVHAANNLFAGLFANYEVSALPSPSLFTVQTLDPAYGLISLVVGMIVFYIVFFRVTRSGSAKPLH
ncbi:MAG TPA: CPBP family intramembrane glutamic endopeptidase [Anaerolineales bacterium]|jgi:membrane protease YdiL (CAAX protease family)|nr:CPBP family intramembrane glutamic endopeptidase [Anaerolineales bacterium]